MTDADLDEDGRPAVPLAGDEIGTLLGFLDYQRATMAWKCRGLDDEQLRAALPPTSMTLGGMLMHLARVEDNWFSEVVAEGAKPEPWDKMDWAAEWQEAAAHTGDDLRQLRWVLVHMIEEYARHNRHADLLRESIDGETGE